MIQFHRRLLRTAAIYPGIRQTATTSVSSAIGTLLQPLSPSHLEIVNERLDFKADNG